MRRQFAFSILVLMALGLSACSDKPVKGNGKILTEARNVSNYSAVDIKGNFNVSIKSGQSGPDLRITTDQNLQPYLLTMVKKNTLLIIEKKGFDLKPTQPIQISVSAKNIKVLQLEGDSKLELSNVSGDLFTLETEGASQSVLSGKVDNFTLTMLGRSTVDARNLLAKNVDLKARAETVASIYAKDKLNADLTDSATVTYYGGPPVINQRVFGKSKLNKAGE